MAHSDSEDEVEAIDDLEFDNRSSDADEVIEEDTFGMDVDQEEGSDGDDVCSEVICFRILVLTSYS
jgi:hypothetical protein